MTARRTEARPIRASSPATVTVRRGGSDIPLSVTLTAPQRARLGLDLVRARGTELAARVQRVDEGSAAAAAGFQAGDEIVAWAGQRLEFSSREERRAFDRMLRTSVDIGDIVPVTVRRDDGKGGATEVELRLVAR